MVAEGVSCPPFQSFGPPKVYECPLHWWPLEEGEKNRSVARRWRKKKASKEHLNQMSPLDFSPSSPKISTVLRSPFSVGSTCGASSAASIKICSLALPPAPRACAFVAPCSAGGTRPRRGTERRLLGGCCPVPGILLAENPPKPRENGSGLTKRMGNQTAGNVDPGVMNPCLVIWAAVPSKSDKSPLKPATPPYQ